DSSLARGAESLYASLAGAHADPGKAGIVRSQNPSTWIGEGRGAAPSLAHPSPKTKPGRLHRRLDRPFKPKSQDERPETNSSDILKKVSIFHYLEGCL